MQNNEQLKRNLAQNLRELKNNFKIKKIGMFGSYIRNEQKTESDLDLLVEFTETPSLFKFIRLENCLTKTLGVKVDLVMKSALKPEIGKFILKEVVYL